MLTRVCLFLALAPALAIAERDCLQYVTPDFASPLTRIPSNGTRLVVVLGSSTAVGLGASDTAHSWVGLLTATLTARGFTVINKSISGSVTQNSLSRFATDVVPYRPDFVVLCTSLWNENFATDPLNVRNSFMMNTQKLIGMVDAIGAVPILVGPYPNSASTPLAAQVIGSIYASLETMGVPVWDFWNGLADARGNWLPGLSQDGTHPLDAGHRDLFDAIPTSYFDAAYTLDDGGSDIPEGSWLTGGGAAGRVAVEVAQPLGSWSAAVWFRMSDAATPLGILSATGSAWLHLIRNPNGYELDLDGLPVLTATAAPEIEPVWHQVLITYAQEPKVLALYVDGVPLASRDVIDPIHPTRFSVGGDGDPDHFSHFLVYRIALDAGNAMDLRGYGILRKSIESWIKLNVEADDGLVNSASTSTTANALGDWRFDPMVFVGSCSALIPRPAPPDRNLP